MSIVVLVPSRGRPERAFGMAASVLDTAEGNVEVWLLIDLDDPEHDGYLRRAEERLRYGDALKVTSLVERLRYTGSLNEFAPVAMRAGATILGAFGDDVVFRTPGWDRVVEATLAMPGMAYGDDLIHGRNHPSAVFMSSEIAKALGWLALPAVWHTWADDGWKRLGERIPGLLRYMPDVVVEHMHYGVGKSEEDATYREVYSSATGDHDYPAFAAWLESGLAEDAARIRAAIEVPA